jgi:hypothetical protein
VASDPAKGTSAPSLAITSNSIIAATSDRVMQPFSVIGESPSRDRRTAFTPAALAGAGSDPTAADLLGDALTAQASEAAAAATDSFFALLADPPLRAE